MGTEAMSEDIKQAAQRICALVNEKLDVPDHEFERAQEFAVGLVDELSKLNPGLEFETFETSDRDGNRGIRLHFLENEPAPFDADKAPVTFESAYTSSGNLWSEVDARSYFADKKNGHPVRRIIILPEDK